MKNGKLHFADEGFASLTWQHHEDITLISAEDQFGLPILTEDTYFDACDLEFDHWILKF